MDSTLSAILFQDASAYAAELCERSELLRHARAGLLNGRSVLRYLSSLRYLTEESVRLLERAVESAKVAGSSALAAHYQEKLREETGHHLWAESDMRGLAQTFGLVAIPEPSPALKDLMAFLEQEIAVAPVRYLAYGLLAEHVTVAVGPEWIAALERSCGISRSHLSVVDNHVKLDQAHVGDGLAEIDALATFAELPAMRHTIRTAIEHFDRFFAELSELVEAV